MKGVVAVLGEGFGQALRASRVLRNASLYVGLLFVILAGGGVLAELGIATWAGDFRTDSLGTLQSAQDAVSRAQLILLFGILGCEIVLVDGTAIGITLLGSRMVGVPATLGVAIARARQVFWRLVGVGVLVALAQLLASAIVRAVTGPQGLTDLTIDPLAGALVSVPFVLATTSIVIADDSVGAALVRSFGLVRRSWLVAIALAIFSLALGLIALFCLGSGFDILGRIVDAIHLDVRNGVPSFILTTVLGLAIVSALGSILFTAGAVVSGAQVAAGLRFGMPVIGLGRVIEVPLQAPEEVEPTEPVDRPELAEAADVADPAEVAGVPGPPEAAMVRAIRRVTVPMQVLAALLGPLPWRRSWSDRRTSGQPAPSSSRRSSSMPRWCASSWRTVRRTSSSSSAGSREVLLERQPEQRDPVRRGDPVGAVLGARDAFVQAVQRCPTARGRSRAAARGSARPRSRSRPRRAHRGTAPGSPRPPDRRGLERRRAGTGAGEATR